MDHRRLHILWRLQIAVETLPDCPIPKWPTNRYAESVVVRYYTIRAYGRVGVAAIAPDARYCAILWQGEHRIERRHIPGSQWKQLEIEATAASSSVAIDSEVHRAFAPNDATADIMATDLIDVSAAPLRIAAAIDAQLREQSFTS